MRSPVKKDSIREIGFGVEGRGRSHYSRYLPRKTVFINEGRAILRSNIQDDPASAGGKLTTMQSKKLWTC
jgi:hypothetical protein